MVHTCFYSIIRKKDKKTSKPRRITLTSMQQQHHHSSTHTAHFTPPLLTSDSWSSHPAFVAEATTASVPSPLSEERRLLRKERSKLRKSGGSATKLLSQLDTKCKDMLSIQTSQSGVSGRVQNCSPTDSAVNDSVSPSTTPLDTNIHLSLSQASSSTELKLKEDVTGPGPHTSDSPPQSAGVRVCTSTSLTSTPISGSTGSQYTIHIDRISNQKTLNQLSRLYSKMIIGTCTCIMLILLTLNGVQLAVEVVFTCVQIALSPISPLRSTSWFSC